MTTKRFILLCTGALAIGANSCAAFADTTFKSSATPGTRQYRYTSLERAQGQPDRRYRVDFDLVTGADQSVVAVIRKAQSASGEVWSTPAVDAACQRALHGRGQELARVTLSPVSPAVAVSLGDAFMAMCAPAAYFFPITDILNVAVIQMQPDFHLAELTKSGMSARYGRFETKLDRLGVAIVAASPGGQIRAPS